MSAAGGIEARFAGTLGAFTFDLGFRVAITGRFTAPQPQDQWQQTQQCEEHNR